MALLVDERKVGEALLTIDCKFVSYVSYDLNHGGFVRPGRVFECM